MTSVEFLEQALDGVEFGTMLFLIAAGLTLIFGIMNLVNLAHGVLFMTGAYMGASMTVASGSHLVGVLSACLGTLVVGVVMEVGIYRQLYDRSPLDQVLASFGLVLVFNESVRVIWGPSAIFATTPDFLSGQVYLLPGLSFPVYRVAIMLAGLCAGAGLAFGIGFTKVGMLIRAGASNRTMVGALGVNIRLLYTIVFGIGAALAGLAGALAGPILTIQAGMGDDMLILALVVITIGGVGSVKGAFVASLLVGVIDAVGRSGLRPAFGLLLSPRTADNAAPAASSMLIYLVMALVLIFRPQGLFPRASR